MDHYSARKLKETMESEKRSDLNAIPTIIGTSWHDSKTSIEISIDLLLSCIIKIQCTLQSSHPHYLLEHICFKIDWSDLHLADGRRKEWFTSMQITSTLRVSVLSRDIPKGNFLTERSPTLQGKKPLFLFNIGWTHFRTKKKV